MLFTPIFKDRIWGGQRLRTSLNKDVPPDRKIGESWEIVDLPGDESLIANGPQAGRSLREAIGELGSAITGDIRYRQPFPLQTRFINAEDILSVQVHPGADACRRIGAGRPKTEAWYIIEAEPGAYLYKGFRRGADERVFRQALEDGSVAELLDKVPVAPGQCHLIPTGAGHAIGPGILIAEVQTPSDTTYRVYDWDRVDASGRKRELHLQQALQSIRFDIHGEDLPATTEGRLVDCAHFTVDKGRWAAGATGRLPGGSAIALTILSGGGQFTGTGAGTVSFRRGDSLLVPAAFEGRMEFSQDCECLIASATGQGEDL